MIHLYRHGACLLPALLLGACAAAPRRYPAPAPTPPPEPKLALVTTPQEPPPAAMATVVIKPRQPLNPISAGSKSSTTGNLPAPLAPATPSSAAMTVSGPTAEPGSSQQTATARAGSALPQVPLTVNDGGDRSQVRAGRGDNLRRLNLPGATATTQQRSVNGVSTAVAVAAAGLATGSAAVAATATPAPARPGTAAVSPTTATAARPMAPSAAAPRPATPSAAAASNAARYDTVTEYERQKLATMPLPKLPTLVSREEQAAQQAARWEPVPAPANPVEPPPPPPPPKPIASQLGAELKTLLRKANDRTGLDDAQLARIIELETRMVRGEEQPALIGLLKLNDELDAAVSDYVVGNGESLWQIAAKAETYGNANLWPLIWRANPKTLPRPSQLRSGQKLQLPRYPSLGDVSDALEYARTHTPDGRKR